MSVTTENPTVPDKRLPSPVLRNGRWAGYRHLLAARLLELKREPEVVFWVFVFPMLLALGLGIAFRNKPADAASVAIVADAAPPEKSEINLFNAPSTPELPLPNTADPGRLT